MSFLERLFTRAKSDLKTIALPESHDPRILEAASRVAKDGVANIILLGEEEEVNALAAEHNYDLEGIEIVSIKNNPNKERYAKEFFELRKHKGITEEQALETVNQELYLATMMLKLGDVDGVVAGAVHSSSNVLRPALQVVKTAPDAKIVSAFFIMDVPNSEFGANGVFAFGDSGMVENPDADKLSEIAISTAKSFEALVEEEPRVALLSYSTKGSANSSLTQKVIEATRLVNEKAPDLKADGELQVDAAIDAGIAKSKAPESDVAGSANVLIFPDLNAGNIGYKLVQRLAKADAFGPLTQGLAKPMNDLSRGSTVEDIVGTIAITAVQAQAQ